MMPKLTIKNASYRKSTSTLPVGPGAWWTLQNFSPCLITTQNLIALYHSAWTYAGKSEIWQRWFTPGVIIVIIGLRGMADPISRTPS